MSFLDVFILDLTISFYRVREVGFEGSLTSSMSEKFILFVFECGGSTESCILCFEGDDDLTLAFY